MPPRARKAQIRAPKAAKPPKRINPLTGKPFEYELKRRAVILHGGPRAGFVYYLDHMIQERVHGEEIKRPCPYRETQSEDVHPHTMDTIGVWVYDPDPTRP